MRYFLSAISIIIILSITYWFANKQTDDISSEVIQESIHNSAVEEINTESRKLGKIINGETTSLQEANDALLDNANEPILTQAQARQQMITMQAKIDVLMQKYENNMSDPDSRAQVRREMESLIKKYDQFALQVAMEKMRNG
jgi:hypothetical protein